MEKVQIPRRKPTVENKADKKVRGRPFQAGNPGRPLGSKNRTTRLVEQLLDGEAEAITRKFLELALAGNPKCLQLCLDRLLPHDAVVAPSS